MISSNFFNTIFKFLVVVLLIGVVIAGVSCGVAIYDHKQQKSATYGSINYHDVYADFSIFEHDFSDAIFYKQDGLYKYNETIPVGVNFDGTAHKYNVLLNDTPADTESSSSGMLYSTHYINHYALTGELTHTTEFTLEIKFYQSSLEITMSTDSTPATQGYFLEYVNFNGLNLSIISSQYTKI